MEQVSINKNMKLSQHFSLGELTKSNHPEVYNIPSHTAIENLKRICENWLEDLRYSYNMLYVHTGVRPQSKVDAGVDAGVRPQSKVAGDCTLAPDPRPAGSTLVPDPGAAPEEPIIINSGYRSPEVNLLAGGAKTSNHLSGCAVDIRCAGKEQMIRYASILLDIADGTRQEFDELLLEQHGNVCWLHFAVKPKDNRRRIEFLKA
jgi:hypothetical protein